MDSTNNFLKKELSKSAPLPEGTVIMAEEQFAGRGQINNVWISESGKNLTFSLLLSPTFLSPKNQFLLNQCISIAINDVLGVIIGAEVKIKWPNDVYFNNEKLGGILIENILRGSIIKYAIVGIGLNVNQINFSDDIKNVTSMKKILHRDYDLTGILNDLCSAIEYRYLQLRAGKYDLIKQNYIHNLYRLNEKHAFIIDGQQVWGEIKGTDENGLLQILINNDLRKYIFKEISFVI